jgi:hypothetical protein
MPEGLSPIEVGKQLHEHTSEPHQPDDTRHWRIVQIGEAVLCTTPSKKRSGEAVP